jgi:hypothetical protein
MAGSKDSKGKDSKGMMPYYEADGALRAFANRVVLLNGLLAVVVAVLGAVVLVTRSKPPVVIRIGPDGQATVISPEESNKASKRTVESVKASEAPTEVDKESFVKSFVNFYWGYDEHTLADHWSMALNMMQDPLKKSVLAKMSAQGTVGELQTKHDKSTVTITRIDPDPADPLIFHVLANRIETWANDTKSYGGVKRSEAYTIQLVETDRTIKIPSGLLVGGIKRDEVSSEPYLLNQQ